LFGDLSRGLCRTWPCGRAKSSVAVLICSVWVRSRSLVAYGPARVKTRPRRRGFGPVRDLTPSRSAQMWVYRRAGRDRFEPWPGQGGRAPRGAVRRTAPQGRAGGGEPGRHADRRMAGDGGVTDRAHPAEIVRLLPPGDHVGYWIPRRRRAPAPPAGSARRRTPGTPASAGPALGAVPQPARPAGRSMSDPAACSRTGSP